MGFLISVQSSNKDHQAALYQDPFLARILALGVLDKSERLMWIGNAKAILTHKRAELILRQTVGDYEEAVRDAGLRIVEIQLSCLNDLHSRLNDSPGLRRASSGHG